MRIYTITTEKQNLVKRYECNKMWRSVREYLYREYLCIFTFVKTDTKNLDVNEAEINTNGTSKLY